MKYDRIKQDVKRFQEIVRSYGIAGYCALGSLILAYCLDDHGIKAELVRGYMVIGDTYWVLHVWNKIHLSGKEHQIDVVKNPAKEMGFDTQYTLVLKDKWQSIIDTTKEQQDHDNIVEFMNIYQQGGRDAALMHLKENRWKGVDDTWKKIFDETSHLKTFKSIKKYKDLMFA
jgi:hypothetical protein